MPPYSSSKVKGRGSSTHQLCQNNQVSDVELSVVSGGSGLSALFTVSKQSVTFPTWDSDKCEGWQSFAMRSRAFAKRNDRREVDEVVIGTRAIATRSSPMPTRCSNAISCWT